MRYVALGSLMAAPGSRPVSGSPFPRRTVRSELRTSGGGTFGRRSVDVTFSGATTAHILRDSQRGAPPQADVLDGVRGSGHHHRRQ